MEIVINGLLMSLKLEDPMDDNLSDELKQAIMQAMLDSGQSKETAKQFTKLLNNFVIDNYHSEDLVDMIKSINLSNFEERV